MPSLTSLVPLLLAVPAARAHMSIFTESMYGLVDYDAQASDPNPVAPLGPDWNSQDEWWFRGPAFRALSPAKRGSSAVSELPAGGTFNTEIACHIAWTSLGCCEWQVSYNQWTLDACPNNAGAYHSGDPNAETIDDNLLSGCALAIADVDDIDKVTMDNLVVFSVQHDCVKQKDTSFSIPAAMPACTGEKCICGWFWLANNGTANFYMTAFDCKVTNVSPSAKKIALPPKDPKWCDPSDKSCKTQDGPKRPLYAYNQPTNVQWHGNDDRPGYHDNWSFKNGAQNDIFVSAAVVSSKTTTTTTTTTAKTTTTTAARASLVGGAQSVSRKPTTTTTTTTRTTTTKKTTTTTTKKKTTTTTHKTLGAAASKAQAKAASILSKSLSLSKAKAAAKSKAAGKKKIAVRGVPLYGDELVADRMFEDIIQDDE